MAIKGYIFGNFCAGNAESAELPSHRSKITDISWATKYIGEPKEYPRRWSPGVKN